MVKWKAIQKIRDIDLYQLQDYLDKTHKLNLEGACELLLNKNFNLIINDFIKDKQKDNNLDQKR